MKEILTRQMFKDVLYTMPHGNGPTDTENKCAIRTIKDGAIVLGDAQSGNAGLSMSNKN